MKKIYKFIKRVLAAGLSLSIIIMAFPNVQTVNVEAADNTVNTLNSAFSVTAYDTSVRIEIPEVESANSYKIYMSQSHDTSLASLTEDKGASCALSSNSYKPYDYVLDGDSDALNPEYTISIIPETTYYFYLVTSDDSNDILQASFKADTYSTADCYWTSSNHYDIDWYSANKDASTYTITTEAQLAGLAVLNNGLDDVSAVNFSGRTIYIAESMELSEWLWTPIGTSERPFRGTIKGILTDPVSGDIISCTHTIQGIHTNAVLDYQGLFGKISGYSRISDIGVVDGFIKGRDCIGGVAGAIYETSLYNCYSTGIVKGDNFCGGIAGICFSGSIISNCYNTGNVEGQCYEGGIAAENVNDAAITNCYNTGTIKGISDVGGIIGINYGTVSISSNTGTVYAENYMAGGISGCSYNAISDSFNSGNINGTNSLGGIAGISNNIIANCYNTGEIKGTYCLGGIAATIDNHYNNASILNCYNSGGINGTQDGGIICINRSEATISNCYYNKDIIVKDNGYGTGKTTNEMINIADSLGTNFVTAPSYYADGGVFSKSNPVNNGYPVLASFGYTGGSDIDSQFIKDSSTGFYMVKNAYQMDLVRYYCGSGDSDVVFNLAGNVDLSEAAYNNTEMNWMSIGTEECPFNKTFSGAGYSISGITISEWSCRSGLFGYNTGSIKELGVTCVNITSWASTGSVTGYNTGVVTNCSSSGTLRGVTLGDDIGGIAGTSEGENSKISGCSSACAISGGGWIGGIIGYNDSPVSDCTNTGSVIGLIFNYSPGEGNEIGGIVGVSSIYSLTGCNNKGRICGNRNVGGIAGYITNMDGELSGCSNTGSIFGNMQTGGIVGCIRVSDTLKNCYNEGSVTGCSSDSSSIGGICGITEIGVQTCYNTGAVTANSNVGGIAGTMKYYSVIYCYNTGIIYATGSDAGGIVGNDIYGSNISSCYSIGTVQGNIAGGIIGNKSTVTCINNNYWGCDRGIGSDDVSDHGAMSFTALEADSIKPVGATSIIERNDTIRAYDYDEQLGKDFTVSYSSYQSDNTDSAEVLGLNVKGRNIGTANISGVITIIQNDLNMVDDNGFTGEKKTFIVPVSMPVSITQATPAMKVNTAVDSVTIGDALTLEAVINNAYEATGIVTFYNNGIPIGSTESIVNGVASVSYIPVTVDSLTITAGYNGDINNISAISENEKDVTVLKQAPTLGAVTVIVNFRKI